MALLHRQLSGTKWRALVLIVLASVLVSTPYIDDNDDDSTSSEEESTAPGSSTSAGSLSLGFGAVLLEVVLSGAASVYFEKVVKSADEQFTLWERNIQLGVYSVALYVGMLIYDAAVNGKIIGSGWSWITLVVAMLGAAGGLLVALSLKYADAILKALATSGAIVLSSLGGWVLLDGPMTLPVALGSVVAIVATMNYTFDDTPLPESIRVEAVASKVPAAI
jgi:UDP-sugar transporter A1/2/3